MDSGKARNIEQTDEFKSTIEDQLALLHRFWQEESSDEQRISHKRFLLKLKHSFEQAASYQLTEHEKQLLLDDLIVTNNLLSASATYFTHSKINANFDAVEDAEKKLKNAFTAALKQASEDRISAREIFSYIGVGLAVLAIGAAITTLVIGLPILVVSGCLLGAVLFNVAAGINDIHLNNFTFFGQTKHTHELMLDLACKTEDQMTKAMG